MPDLESEYILSRFKEAKLLSDSGKSQVYLVIDTTTNRPYIKRVFFKDTNMDIYGQLQALAPKNIPRIHHIIEGYTNKYVIEEYISGVRLDELIGNKGKFDVKQVIEWVLSLCDTLVQLHNSNPQIIHRDIKPSNIIITDDGTPKLIDFNISRNYKRDRNSDTRFFGTEYYAAPEQYGFAQTDARTDLFSIGRLMIVLLTGKQVDCSSELINLTKLKPIISKCCAIDPKDRYKDISGLIKVLRGDVGIDNISTYNYDSVMDECFRDFNSNPKSAIPALMKLYSALISLWRFNEDLNVNELYNLLECIYVLKACVDESVYLPDRNELLSWALQWFNHIHDRLISDWKSCQNSDFERLLLICALIKMLSGPSDYELLIHNAELTVYNVLGKLDRAQKINALYAEKHKRTGMGTLWHLNVFAMKTVLFITRKAKLQPKSGDTDAGRWFYSNQLLDEKLFAIKGASDDMLQLGKYYLYGDGAPRNHHRALFWFNRLIEHGNAEAMYLAATIYESQESSYHNIKQCLRWYIESAESDNPSAQLKLHEIYHEGLYVLRDEAKARYWCELAAKQRHPEALAILET